jgi:Flp pilus assembly secretin CpaC/tetratricopeptide (TPR) repeat protein
MKKHLIPVASLALFASCGSSVPVDESTPPPAEESPSLGSSTAPAAANSGSTQEPGNQSGGLAQEAAKLSDLRGQKTALLVADRLDFARSAYADGRLQDAANQLGLALDLDPANAEARAFLTQVEVDLGLATTADDGSDPRLKVQAKLQAIQAQTQAEAERGARLLAEGDYAEAIGALQLANANIEAVPFSLDWGDLPAQVSANLDKAYADRETAEAASLNQQRQSTFDALQNEERARRSASKQRLEMMLEESIQAYAEEDFDRAISLSEEVLRKNPLETRAAEVRDASVRTRHELVSSRFVEERQERFRLWLEDLQESRIPQSELFVGPDAEYWNKITLARGDKYGAGAFTAKASLDPLNQDIARALVQETIPALTLEGETDLNAVIEQFKVYVDIPFVVHQAAVDAVDGEGIEFNINLVAPTSVINALNTVVDEAGEEVVYIIEHGVVQITTKENAYGDTVTQPHDIQDLTVQFTDFSGPRIDRIWLPDDEANEEEEGSLYGGPFGEPRTLVNPDEIADLVMNTVAPGTWDDNTAEYANGFLIVTHTAEVQGKVNDFLENLRRYNSAMVSIEARFLTIQKDFMKEVGIDFRGLGGFPDVNDLVDLDDITAGLEDNSSAGLDNNGSGQPLGADTNPSAGLFFDEAGRWQARARTENILGDYGTERMSAVGGLTMQFAFLDDAQSSLILRAVEKSNRAQELNSSTVTALNTQRAFMTVLNQVTYIQDMDVEVAQASSAADPIIGVVSDGIVIDVRPIISHDRKYITLELQPTVATLLRPIPEFTSSLSGLTTPVTLQLPELFIASAKTNAIVPDGGTVVIAGLRKLLDIEQRAEIPFLAKIPILSVLFKSEGEAYENEDIIVLIRAQILDNAETIAELDRRRANG